MGCFQLFNLVWVRVRIWDRLRITVRVIVTDRVRVSKERVRVSLGFGLGLDYR